MRRRHRSGKITKTGSSRKNTIAWKNHKNATDVSRMALCVLHEYMVLKHYDGDVDEPCRRNPGCKWVADAHYAVTSILKKRFGHCNVRTTEGEGDIIDLSDIKYRSHLNSRWTNFFHQYDRYSKRWCMDDSEHPLKHEELLPLRTEAMSLVKQYLRK